MDDNKNLPCKNCGSLEYVNADQIEFDHTPDGKFIVEPITCDMCDPDLVYIPPKNEWH